MPTRTCIQCFQAVGSNKELYIHSRNTGHVSWSCDLCQMAFETVKGLSAHLKSKKIHRGKPDAAAFAAQLAPRASSSQIESYGGLSNISMEGSTGSYISSPSSFAVVSAPTSPSFSVISIPSSLDLSSTFESINITDSGSDNDCDEEEEIIPFCTGCGLLFPDVSSLYRHYKDDLKHNWCFACSRDFRSGKALKKHCRSKVHCERKFPCPFCSRKFTLASSVANHLESGLHGVTRHQITAVAHGLKIIPTIVITPRIQEPGQLIPTPAPLVKLFASESAFNGSAYVCARCPHRQFLTIQRLERHLNSAVHDAAEFKCPQVKCGREFSLISGFIQHIESRTCGLAEFKEIERRFSSLHNQLKQLLLVQN